MPTIVDREAAIAALAEEWDALFALAADLAPDDWDRPTACPGWTVKDNLSHVLGTEAMLLGRPTPDVDISHRDADLRNDIARFNEHWVEAYRSRPPAELVADLRAIVAERRAQLDGMDQAAFDAESFTPAGPDTYGRFMRIRVMDTWFHEQDIREAAGRPGHLEGLAPATALGEVASVLGYVVGKKAAAPAGSGVRFVLTGPLAATVDVEVGDRARVVEALAGEPTVTLTVPGDRFLRMCGGRLPDAAGAVDEVAIEGDRDLGGSVVRNLAFTI
jgi:uncharacterized protein (TIGR03083 family)